MTGHDGGMTAGRARALLGVGAAADADALTRAYRTAVKAAHPDRAGGDVERLREVIEAHRLLRALADARLAFAPARQAPRPASSTPPAPAEPAPVRTLRLQISVAEALFGGERRVDVGGGRWTDVQLPAGLRAGEGLRLAGADPGGGDVLLLVGLAPDAGLSVRGDDVWLELSLPAWQLCEGARLEIDTPRGRRAFVAPPGVETGAPVRLKGEGLPARGRRAAGDLIVRLNRDGVADESASRRLLRRFSARWAA